MTPYNLSLLEIATIQARVLTVELTTIIDNSINIQNLTNNAYQTLGLL